MGERRTPSILLARLQEKHPNIGQLDFQLFRGLKNPSNFCSIIALLQLLFHCPKFLEIIRNNEQNGTLSEKLLAKLIKKIYNKQDTKSVSVDVFTNDWDKWNENKYLPEQNQIDIMEFFHFLFMDFTQEILDLFQIIYIDEQFNPIQQNFICIQPTSDNLRMCIQDFLVNIKDITRYPQYLFINLNRLDVNSINNGNVDVNSCIQIFKHFYKFVGVAVFTGVDQAGHYYDIIKIGGEFFQFNEHNVNPMFIDKQSTHQSHVRIEDTSFDFGHNSTLFLYEITNHDNRLIENFALQNNTTIYTPLNYHQNNVTISESHENFSEIPHIFLNRELINVREVTNSNLLGTMMVNQTGVPSRVQKPYTENRFKKLRRIFKMVGTVMKRFHQQDQGLNNAELTQIKLKKSDMSELEFIMQQGCILRDLIINNLCQLDEITLDIVENTLQPVTDAINTKYGEIDETEENPPIFRQYTEDYPNNDDEYFRQNDEKVQKKKNEEKEIRKRQHKEMMESMINDMEERFGMDLRNDPIGDMIHGIVQRICQKNEEEDNEEYSDYDLYIPNEEEEEEESYEQRSKQNEQENTSLNKLSHTVKTLIQLFAPDIIFEEDKECEGDFDDDNKITKHNYDYRTRHEVLNIREIKEMLVFKGQKKCKVANGEFLAPAKIRSLIRHQLITDFCNTNMKNWDSRSNFVRSWKQQHINDNNDLIKIYKKIRKVDEYPLTETSMLHWISNFLKMDEKKQNDYLKNIPEPIWGGERKTKSTDDCIMCIICLVLDFPNMSTRDITDFLNSPRGPCKDKKISDRQVRRILQSLRFTVKKVAFSPPNRNTIGLRIYRAAWSLILLEISKQKNVLLTFVDEAGVSVNDGRKYGRSLIGVTPMINNPLTNAKISVLGMTVPGFGVLYRFCNSAVDSRLYAAFLRDCINFLRKYVCSSNVEIVTIEDNCQIHTTAHVEQTIGQIEIAVLPTVPYSPALNECIEGYFGIVKLHHCIGDSDTEECETYFVPKIKDNWERISNQYFTCDTSMSLYSEWKERLYKCIQGHPLVSGHVHIEPIEKHINELLNIPVFRQNAQINNE